MMVVKPRLPRELMGAYPRQFSRPGLDGALSNLAQWEVSPMAEA